MTCSLCKQEITGKKHRSADPLSPLPCCEPCYHQRVVPARLALIKFVTDEEDGTLTVH